MTIDANEMIEKQNEAYFKSFITSRGGMSVLQISWAGVVVSLLCLLPTWSTSLYYYEINPINSKINVLLIIILCFMLVTFIVINFTVVRKFLAKHQGFLSIWECIFICFTTFILMFMTYIVSQLGNSTRIMYGSSFSILIIFLFCLWYISCIIYNLFWLKKQLETGFSVKRRNANYMAKSKVYESKSLWIIFAVTMSGAFLTGNMYKILGFMGGLLFGGAFSRLTVELGYSAYLLNTSKDYWVNYIEKPNNVSWQTRLKARFKKISTYVVLGIDLIIIMSQVEERYEVPEEVHVVLAYLGRAIVIGFGIAFVVWLVKTIKKKLKG